MAEARPIRRASRPSNSRFLSSLDIVWSFSRSHAYIGSQLPSSPSFVNHYNPPRPGKKDQVRSTSGGTSSRRSSTVERERRGSQATSQYSADLSEESEEDDSALLVDPSLEWNDLPNEPLPKNALRPARSRKSKRRSSHREVRAINQPVTATEQTPLLPTNPSLPLNAPLQHGMDQSYTHSMIRDYNGKDYDAERSSDEEEDAYLLQQHSVQGLSTFAQTLFNTVNILVGVGILAEPLAFAHAGWILGTLILLFCGIITNYTAKILANILAQRPVLNTYADIGAAAFGRRARTWISVLFCLELSALSVALVVLWGDSMNTLFPQHSSAFYKFIGFFVITPTIFLPLRLLSFTSLIGIISTIGLLIVVYIDGASKKTAPGSLVQHAVTSFKPDWKRLPLSFGLVMSGFSGHAVMPSIARDMKSPRQFNTMINLAYIAAFTAYLLMAIAGYLMFGGSVSDEITRNMLATPGYPRQVTRLAVWAIALNPICKFAIGTRPLNSTLEYILGIDKSHEMQEEDEAKSVASSEEDYSPNTTTHSGKASLNKAAVSANASVVSRLDLTAAPAPVKNGVRIFVKVATTALVVVVAIYWPGFESVMSFLGAFSAFVICVQIPVVANLVLNWHEISRTRLVVDSILLAISVVMTVTGTVCAFLPL